jgi:hypothetical protein
MKQYLLSIIFLFSLACNIGFGQQNCATDLSVQKGDLEKVIGQIDEKFDDKGKLQDLLSLFKSCVNKQELDNIKNTYLNLKFKAPQQEAYRGIIKKVLDDNKLLCVDFVKNAQEGGSNKNYVVELNALLQEYENLKRKNTEANSHEETPTEKNYNILSKLRQLLGDCTIGEDLKKVQKLNNQIITEGFNGGKTSDFKANLREVLNSNSELLKVPTAVITTTKDSPKILETPNLEEIEAQESDFNFGIYLFYILFAVSILANAYFLYERFMREPEEVINTKPENGSTAFDKQTINGLEQTNNSLSKKIKKLEKKLEVANDEIKGLKTLPKQSKKVIETYIAPVNPSKGKMPVPIKNIYTKQYFASPTSNGEFLAKNGQSEVKSGASIYVFSINGSEATFKFHNDPSTFQATINDPGNRIKPVCDAKNAYNPAAKEIITETAGKATLVGDKWEVKVNAKIRYKA